MSARQGHIDESHAAVLSDAPLSLEQRSKDARIALASHKNPTDLVMTLHEMIDRAERLAFGQMTRANEAEARVASLTEENAQLRADKDAMDYLESLGYVDIELFKAGRQPECVGLYQDERQVTRGATLRAAIAAAIAAASSVPRDEGAAPT